MVSQISNIDFHTQIVVSLFPASLTSRPLTMSSSPPIIVDGASGASSTPQGTPGPTPNIASNPGSPSRVGILPVQGASLTVGMVVLINGVKSRPHLNGTMGTIWSESYGDLSCILFLSETPPISLLLPLRHLLACHRILGSCRPDICRLFPVATQMRRGPLMMLPHKING